MVHFALIQLTKKHTEIFGTFIELILKNNWTLTIYYNLFTDEYSYLPYYYYLFNKEIPLKPTGQLVLDTDNIDYYIYASASDHNRMSERFKTPEFYSKSIYVQHQNYHLKDFMKNNLIVSPVINLKYTNPQYILPIYKSYKKLHYKNPDNKLILAIIGGIRSSSTGKILDRNINLITDILEKYPNQNYEFHFFMRKWDLIAICRKMPFLENHSKIKTFSGLSTPELIKKLRCAKFILPIAKKNGWFYNQRLTGSIPFAINFNIPLLIDRKLAEIYNLQNYCYLYEDNLTEIFDDILNMDINNYHKYIEKIVTFKRLQCKKNEINFKKILQ